MHYAKKTETVLIGGDTEFGSGQVLRQIRNALKPSIFINTSGQSLISVLTNLRHLKKGDDIYFQPSVAKWSVLRDLVYLLFMPKCNVIILCDTEYSRLKGILIFFLKFRKITKIFSPAKISGLRTINFKQIKDTKIKILKNLNKDKKYVYANYLSVDKGLTDFEEFITTNEIKSYSAFGITKEKLTDMTISVEHISCNNEFFRKLTELNENYDVQWCFMSRYDLAPLLVHEILISGCTAVVKKGSKSEMILKNYLGADSLTDTKDFGLLRVNTDIALSNIEKLPAIEELFIKK